MTSMRVLELCLISLLSFSLSAVSDVYADTVDYTLENVILDDQTQMTGTFTWTFVPGDFENGVGQFTILEIPWTSHNQDDLEAIFDVSNSIEIVLPGSVHDDGVDITLFLLQPLTPSTSAPLDLARSRYAIGGNGFHDGAFLSGSIAPVSLVGSDPGNRLSFRLHPSTPNPSGASTTIRYTIPRSVMVDLRVFDSAGRLVRVLENSRKEAGHHHLDWDGTDSAGAPTATGVYFVRFQAEAYRETRKFVRLR